METSTTPAVPAGAARRHQVLQPVVRRERLEAGLLGGSHLKSTVRITTEAGAVIEDVLTGISAHKTAADFDVQLYLTFQNVKPALDPAARGVNLFSDHFKVAANSPVAIL